MDGTSFTIVTGKILGTMYLRHASCYPHWLCTLWSDVTVAEINEIMNEHVGLCPALVGVR